jgi:hypothetical protein
MKNVIFTFAMSLVLACSAQKNSLQIPANKTVQLDYPDYALWRASLNNKSMAEIRVVVVNKSTMIPFADLVWPTKAKQMLWWSATPTSA